MKWWGHLGLWPRMALALSAGFLLVFGAFAGLGEYALRESANETRHEYLVIARLAAAQIDARIGEAQTSLAQTGDALSSLPDNADPEGPLAAGAHRMEPEALELVYVDRAGQVIAAAPTSAAPPEGSLGAFVKQAAASGVPSASDPFKDARTGRPAVALSAPITRGGHPAGAVIGVLALDSQSFLQVLSEAVQVGKTGHAGLLDSHGRVLLSTYGLPMGSQGEHPAFYQQVMAARKDEVKTVPMALAIHGEKPGEQHLMAVAMLQRMPWGVDVGGDASEAFAASRHLQWGLIIIGTVSLVAIWGGSLLGARLLVRPVYGLTRSAQRIAEGNLAVPLEAGAGGEIGAMAEALEKMRLRLLQTIESLEELRATLEARVGERTEALRRQEAQVRQLLHQVITAQEEERARIAYELHDEIGQLLTAILLSMDNLQSTASAEEGARIARVQGLTEQAMSDLRRLISGLRPGVLDQLGLAAALREVAEQILAPLDVRITIDAAQDRRLPPEVEVVLFRIAQQAMSNVAQHSGATTMDLSVVREDGRVTMRVHDNGRGFEPASTGPDTATGRGLGLLGMRERASLLGGSVRIESAPGAGTTVEATLPLPGTRTEDERPAEGGDS